MIEDEESIQYALMEVINALMRNTIEFKRATLIIRALLIAVKNAGRVKFGIQEPVTKIPEYADPTPEHDATAMQSELPAVSAIPYKPVEPHDRHFWEYQAEGTRVLAREAQARNATAQTHLGTAAIARPAQAKPSESVGTDGEACAERSRSIRPGHEATVAPAAATRTANLVSSPAAVLPHDFKNSPSAPRQNSFHHLPATAPQSPSPRKPPGNVKPSSKERKIAANNLP
jgi:hypothetical protein